MPNVSELISQILLKKLRAEELTPQEAATLAEWEARSPEHTVFIEMLMDEASLSEKIRGMLELDERAAWQRIEKALQAEWNERSEPQKRKISWYKYAAAASVIFVLGFGVYYFIISKPSVSETSKAAKPATVTDIAPGGNRAVLTLADGSVVDLGKAANGVVAEQGGSKVIKTSEGKLVYEGGGAATPDGLKYNILETPRGGEFQLTLPDGTKVWLNAASSIKYPVAFQGNERRVEIMGEVYFEVARDSRRKFRTIINSAKGKSKGEVEVLGTHFNIMAYDDEQNVAATLLEGKIKITTGSSPDKSNQMGSVKETVINEVFDPSILIPGQQALLIPNNKITVVNQSDTAQVVAWKNGITSFKDTDLRIVMRQLSRWYKVEIQYADNVPEMQFTGDIGRHVNISKVLDILKFAGLNFKLEEKKIIILP